MTHSRFDKRVVLVTGAAQGIGAAVAEAFCREGALVHIADIDGDAVAARAKALGVPYHALDLSDRDRTRKTVDRIAEGQGPVEILINGAGGVRGQVGQPIEAVTQADWRSIFQANLDGAFWLTQAVAPAMKRAGFGRVVNIASRAGLRPSLTGIQAYTAAKHALVGLTRQLSWELAPHGVTVNAIAPGFFATEANTEMAADPQVAAWLAGRTSLGRWGRTDEIGGAAVFLASGAASFVTGHVLVVDGGHVSHF